MPITVLIRPTSPKTCLVGIIVEYTMTAMMVMMVMMIPTRICLAVRVFIIWRFSYSKLQSSNRMEVTKEVLAKTE